MLLRIPGVYAPQDDTWLLADAMAEHSLDADTRVLDLYTGTGALAVRAAELGAGSVTAIDLQGTRRTLSCRLWVCVLLRVEWVRRAPAGRFESATVSASSEGVGHDALPPQVQRAGIRPTDEVIVR